MLNSVIKTGFEQKISKKSQLLEEKQCFQNANICPHISPPPSKKNLAKRPFDQEKPWGLLWEFYIITDILGHLRKYQFIVRNLPKFSMLGTALF